MLNAISCLSWRRSINKYIFRGQHLRLLPLPLPCRCNRPSWNFASGFYYFFEGPCKPTYMFSTFRNDFLLSTPMLRSHGTSRPGGGGGSGKSVHSAENVYINLPWTFLTIKFQLAIKRKRKHLLMGRIKYRASRHSTLRQLTLMLRDTYAEWYLCWMMLMLSDAYAEWRLCWVTLMLSDVYAEWYLCWVMLMLSDAYVEGCLCWVMFMLSDAYAEWCLYWVMLMLSYAYDEWYL
jgi:hypothetical protein